MTVSEKILDVMLQGSEQEVLEFTTLLQSLYEQQERTKQEQETLLSYLLTNDLPF